VLEEKVATYYESGNDAHNWRYLPASNEVIWFSERDNWGHLYLYDLQSGRLKSQITSGDGNVTQVLKVDEKNRLHARKVAAISRTVVHDVKAHVAQIEKRIKQIEKGAVAVVRNDAGLREQFEILTGITGVGRRSAILLLTADQVLHRPPVA